MRVSSLPRGRFALLFAVMLVAASGNTAMQSLMPSLGRELGVPDLWVAVAFSLYAVVWVLTAPHWARLSDRCRRTSLRRRGLYVSLASMPVRSSVPPPALAVLLPQTFPFTSFYLVH